MKTAPDKSPSFLTCAKFLGHIIEGTTIATLKSQIDAILKIQPPSSKKTSKNSLECSIFK